MQNYTSWCKFELSEHCVIKSARLGKRESSLMKLSRVHGSNPPWGTFFILFVLKCVFCWLAALGWNKSAMSQQWGDKTIFMSKLFSSNKYWQQINYTDVTNYKNLMLTHSSTFANHVFVCSKSWSPHLTLTLCLSLKPW